MKLNPIQSEDIEPPFEKPYIKPAVIFLYFKFKHISFVIKLFKKSSVVSLSIKFRFASLLLRTLENYAAPKKLDREMGICSKSK
jgi:hypothetical protein